MATLLLTDALADSLAAAVAQGVPIETAAVAAGLGARTVFQWVQAAESGRWPQSDSPVGPQSKILLERFAQSIARAQAEFEAKQVAGIARAAEQVNEKTGQQDWRARAWLLNNHPRTRHTYHEAKELEVTHTEPFLELQQAKAMPDDELRSELAKLSLPAGEDARTREDT